MADAFPYSSGEHVIGPVGAHSVEHPRLVEADLADGSSPEHPYPGRILSRLFSRLPQTSYLLFGSSGHADRRLDVLGRPQPTALAGACARALR